MRSKVQKHTKTFTTAGWFESVVKARAIQLAQLPVRSQPQAILMCEPRYFRVIDVKNPFMEGNVNRTNPKEAAKQWSALLHVFEKLGYPIELISARPGREDMVFTANQVLPGMDAAGHKYVVLANMLHDSRRREIPFFKKWFAAHGYRIIKLQGTTRQPPSFEGQGDALWHPGVQMLWGGWGNRSELRAFQELWRFIDVPIMTLKLVHPSFYHLDTAFCPLDERTVMYYPKAFNIRGNELIRHYFDKVISVSDSDALNFACNALALGKHVILQKGSRQACAQLRRHGFHPIEVETSEFMKSGGSVSCLKMLVYN